MSPGRRYSARVTPGRVHFTSVRAAVSSSHTRVMASSVALSGQPERPCRCWLRVNALVPVPRFQAGPRRRSMAARTSAAVYARPGPASDAAGPGAGTGAGGVTGTGTGVGTPATSGVGAGSTANSFWGGVGCTTGPSTAAKERFEVCRMPSTTAGEEGGKGMAPAPSVGMWLPRRTARVLRSSLLTSARSFTSLRSTQRDARALLSTSP